MIIDEPRPPAPEPGPRSGFGRSASVVRKHWSRVVAICRILAATIFVAVALLGALFTSPVFAFVVGPLMGGFAVGAAFFFHPDFPSGRPARRTTVFTAAGGVLFVPFLTGVGLMGAVGQAVVVPLLVLGAVVTCDRLARIAGAEGSGAEVLDESWLRTVLRSLPLDALLGEWRNTDALLSAAPDGVTRSRTVRVRGLLLDELAARDPAGVESWLQSGSSPESHIRADRDLAG